MVTHGLALSAAGQLNLIMLKKKVKLIIALSMIVFVATPSLHAQQHRATRLGNPATRFSDPLQTTEDLRKMLLSEALRADVDFIARESGFHGNLEDFHRAAATNQIRLLKISVGTRMPAMSSRKNGRPVLLRDVLWAGKKPIDAYQLHFASEGRRYRLVSPKACANFWIEGLGRELRPALTLNCDAPDQVSVGRTANVCLTVKNVGDETEPFATLTLPVPAGATVVSLSGGGKLIDGRVAWKWQSLAPGESKEVCAVFEIRKAGSLTFDSTARGDRSPQVRTRCETRMIGVPAVMLEVIDLTDPIEVGADETYEVTVLNQGTAALTNIRLLCTLGDGQEFVSGTGTTTAQAKDGKITTGKLAALNPKEKATWQIVVKTLTPGDARFATELTCDQFQKPINETEATQQY